MSEFVIDTIPDFTLTAYQRRAIAILRDMPPDHWRYFGPGFGWANVALRGLFDRDEGNVLLKGSAGFSEVWQLARVKK